MFCGFYEFHTFYMFLHVCNPAFAAINNKSCVAVSTPEHNMKYGYRVVVFGNRNFGSVSVLKKPNRILFVKPYFTVTAVLYKTDVVRFPVHADAVSDNNRYQTYVPSFNSFRS